MLIVETLNKMILLHSGGIKCSLHLLTSRTQRFQETGIKGKLKTFICMVVLFEPHYCGLLSQKLESTIFENSNQRYQALISGNNH